MMTSSNPVRYQNQQPDTGTRLLTGVQAWLDVIVFWCPDTLSRAQIVPSTVTTVMQGDSTLTRKPLLSPTHHTFGPFCVDSFVTTWLPPWKVTAPRWGAVSF